MSNKSTDHQSLLLDFMTINAPYADKCVTGKEVNAVTTSFMIDVMVCGILGLVLMFVSVVIVLLLLLLLLCCVYSGRCMKVYLPPS